MKYRVGDKLKVNLVCKCPGCTWLSKQAFVTVKRVNSPEKQYYFEGEHEGMYVSAENLAGERSELLQRVQNLDMFKRR